MSNMIRIGREREVVQWLGEEIGYGRVMQLAEELWREKLLAMGLEGGEFKSGPCASQTVSCEHPVLDKNGHCEVCCGAGWVTRWVAAKARG